MRDKLTNLLAETLESMTMYHIKEEDVLWVGPASSNEYMTWEEFKEFAAGCNYDCRWKGEAFIPLSLVVVTADKWLARWEYDGSEGWRLGFRPVHTPEATKVRFVETGWGLGFGS